MSETFSAPFEGANGSAATTTNTNFTGITGTAPTFSTAFAKKGLSSMHFPNGVMSRLELVRGSATTRYWSFYMYPTAQPTANTPIFFAGSALTAAGRTFQLTWNSAGTFKIQRDSTAIKIGSDTASAIPLNEWSRMDLSAVGGLISMAFYPGNAQCDNAVGTAASNNMASGQITPTALDAFFVGADTGSAGNYYMDALREDDSVIPGPISAGGPVPTHFRLVGSAWVPQSVVIL